MVAARLRDGGEVVRLLKGAARIAYAAGGEEAASTALELIADFLGWKLGHVYQFDPGRQLLVPTDRWYGDATGRFSSFAELTRRTPLTMGEGLLGRALSAGQPVWMVDVRRESGFLRAAAAAECGICAGLALPIVTARGIENVLELFTTEPVEPDAPVIELLSHVVQEIGRTLDRFRTIAALTASEARLADSQRLGHMGAWLYHVDLDLLEWSNELRAIYGLEPTNTPTTLAEYLSRVHPDELDRVREAITAAIEKRRPFEHEYRLVLRPSEVRWAHSRGEVIGRTGGHSLRLSGYCQDVTERRQREEAMRLAQERLTEAQRLAHLGSWSWEVATNSVSWSEELFRIYGLDEGSSPPTLEAYLERLHPEDRDRVRLAVERTATTGEPFEHEYRIVLPDGEERWVHARGEVVERRGTAAARLAGYCLDITQRRRSEDEREGLKHRLEQSERLESLGQLAGGVAHDFNNLLAVIMNYAVFVDDQLAELAGSIGDERVRLLKEDTGQIARAARRATELTRKLLAFGRREVVHPRVVALNDVVRDIEPLLRRTLGEHVELQISISPDLWRVSADSGQLEQVLVNLALNARDAMASGGLLTIETSNVHVDDELASRWAGIETGRHARLRVIDTGQGMSAEVARRAFEPFFTTKPEGKGTGLGLATVFGIIAQAGGRAQIDSVLGRGTTITVLLPATDAEPAALESALPGRGGLTGTETVLLVEDDDAMREMMRRILARNGYRVIAAAGGREAIEAAILSPDDIHLLVTDVVMPRMLGLEVAAAIEHLLPDVRVLYMSGYAQPALASEGTLHPGVVLLEKPFGEQDLLSRVREALDRPATAVPPSTWR